MDEQTKDMPRTLHVAIDSSPAHHIDHGGKKSGGINQTDKNPDGVLRPMLPLDTLSRLLSERNIDLLKMIKASRPGSVAELARLSGRPKASLTLTLRRLEQFGIVAFEPASGRRKIPVVACDRLMVEVAIAN